MHAFNNKGIVGYCCVTLRKYGKSGCPNAKYYSEHLVVTAVIEFLVEFIRDKINLKNALTGAVDRYGKTVIEEALEAAVQGELISVKAGKDRIIDAISRGILSNQEAPAKLEDLREQEEKLTVELASIDEKVAIREEWLNALEKLENVNLKQSLTRLAEKKPLSFRRLLSLFLNRIACGQERSVLKASCIGGE